MNHYLLDIGDEIMDGDEVYVGFSNWNRCVTMVGTIVDKTSSPIRRKIQAHNEPRNAVVKSCYNCMYVCMWAIVGAVETFQNGSRCNQKAMLRDRSPRLYSFSGYVRTYRNPLDNSAGLFCRSSARGYAGTSRNRTRFYQFSPIHGASFRAR